jgi:two-component system chemotaxis response regulator CheB
MGNDGADAMLALRKAGAQTTIAESEQTCVVYGMPKAALQMKAAEFSLPLHEIAKKLIEVVKQHND